MEFLRIFFGGVFQTRFNLTKRNIVQVGSRYVTILYLKFKMSNHKIVFLLRVVVILPGISLRK